MEERIELKPYQVNYKCDKCNIGYMMYAGGAVLGSNPPQYIHNCNSCGKEETFIKQYPYIEYQLPVFTTTST